MWVRWTRQTIGAKVQGKGQGVETASLTGLQEAVGSSWGPDAQVTKYHHPRAGPRNSEAPGGVHQEAAQQISLVTIATATGAGTWPAVNEGMGRRNECPVEGKRPSKAAPALSCFSYTLQVCLVIFAALPFPPLEHGCGER